MKSYWIKPKSDCIYHAPIDLEQKRSSVWFQISRKMVNTIWFRLDLIIIQKDLSVCCAVSWWPNWRPLCETSLQYSSEMFKEGPQIKPHNRLNQGPLKTAWTSQQYCTELFKEDPQLGPHHVEKREPLRRPMTNSSRMILKFALRL